MKSECCFFGFESCTILKKKDCKNCKFRKTKEEFIETQCRAESALFNKGLMKIEKNGIITTTPILKITSGESEE